MPKLVALSLLAVITLSGTRVVGRDGVRLSWYGDEFRGGPLYCSGAAYDPDDPSVVATSQEDWACGETLEVCGTSCITVTVQDKCGDCTPGEHVDLSRAAWEAVGGVDYGTVRKVGSNKDLPTFPTKLPVTGMGAE